MQEKEQRKKELISVYMLIVYMIFNTVWIYWFKSDLYIFSPPIGIGEWLIKFCTATSYPIIMAYTAKVNYSIAQIILNNAHRNKKHCLLEFIVLFGFIHFLIKHFSNDIAEFTFLNYMYYMCNYQYKIVLYYALLILIYVIPILYAIINKMKNREMIRKIAQLVIKNSSDTRIYVIILVLYLLGNVGVIVYESKLKGVGIYNYLSESLTGSIEIIYHQIYFSIIICYLVYFAIDKLLNNSLIISYAIGVLISYLIVICYDKIESLIPFCLYDYKFFFTASMLIITINCILTGILRAIMKNNENE